MITKGDIYDAIMDLRSEMLINPKGSLELANRNLLDTISRLRNRIQQLESQPSEPTFFYKGRPVIDVIQELENEVESLTEGLDDASDDLAAAKGEAVEWRKKAEYWERAYRDACRVWQMDARDKAQTIDKLHQELRWKDEVVAAQQDEIQKLEKIVNPFRPLRDLGPKAFS